MFALTIITVVCSAIALICFGVAYRHSSLEGRFVAALIAGATLLLVLVTRVFATGWLVGAVVFDVVVTLVASALVLRIARDGAQRG